MTDKISSRGATSPSLTETLRTADLREFGARKGNLGLDETSKLFGAAADEIDRLRRELAAERMNFQTYVAYHPDATETPRSEIAESHATPDAYRWIESACDLLRAWLKACPIEPRDEMLKLVAEANDLLSGVPCPPEDLGFDSPADRYARAWHALNASRSATATNIVHGQREQEDYRRALEEIIRDPEADAVAIAHAAITPYTPWKAVSEEKAIEIDKAAGITTIRVNGTACRVMADAVTYEDVMKLAGFDPKRIFSMTYTTRRGGDEQRQGVMHPGCAPVRIEEGMLFDAGDTSNA